MIFQFTKVAVLTAKVYLRKYLQFVCYLKKGLKAVERDSQEDVALMDLIAVCGCKNRLMSNYIINL